MLQVKPCTKNVLSLRTPLAMPRSAWTSRCRHAGREFARSRRFDVP
jgi:hypothetical protein